MHVQIISHAAETIL